MDDWNYVESAKDPEVYSDTNGTDNVTYAYKVKGADDSTYTSAKPTQPGSYTVRAIFPAVVNYKEVTVTDDFTIIGKQFADLTFADSRVTYDGELHSLAVAGGIPAGCTVTYDPRSVKDAGQHNMKAIISGEGYYTKNLTATLTVDPAKPTVIIAPESGKKIEVGDPIVLTVSVTGVKNESPAGTVEILGQTLTLTDGKAAVEYVPANLQPVSISAVYIPSDSNYTRADGTFRITPDRKARESIVIGDMTKTYGDPAFRLTPAGGSLQEGETYVYESSNPAVATVDADGQVTIKGAGSTNITVSLPETNVYTGARTAMTLTVDKAEITGNPYVTKKPKTPPWCIDKIYKILMIEVRKSMLTT